MEFVMIVEPDEVGRKRLEAVFQTEKPSFSYQITGRPEEALDILEHQKTDVLVCETSLSVLSGREFFTMAKMISPDTVRVAMTSAEHVKDILSFLNECDIYKLIMKPCASFADFIEPVNAALEYHRLKKQAESDLEQANMNLFFSEKDFERIAALYWVNVELLGGLMYPVRLFGVEFELCQQGLALLALVPIWLYRGRQGYHSKPFQYFCYAFYPVHMLILVLILGFVNR